MNEWGSDKPRADSSSIEAGKELERLVSEYRE